MKMLALFSILLTVFSLNANSKGTSSTNLFCNDFLNQKQLIPYYNVNQQPQNFDDCFYNDEDINQLDPSLLKTLKSETNSSLKVLCMSHAAYYSSFVYVYEKDNNILSASGTILTSDFDNEYGTVDIKVKSQCNLLN